MKIKFCGFTNQTDVLECLSLDIDYFGFIVNVKSSKRTISPIEAVDLANLVKTESSKQTVAVVVNPDQSLLEELLSSQAFDIVQLHGQESIALCQQIKPTVEVWKAVTVEFSVETIKNYVEVVDKFVFDLPKNLAAQVNQSSRLDFYQQLTALGKPVFLAGGLNTNNIYDLLTSFQPWGIDVASGLESFPGKKDKTKIQCFLTEVRRFRQNLENQVWFSSCC